MSLRDVKRICIISQATEKELISQRNGVELYRRSGASISPRDRMQDGKDDGL